MTSCDLDVLSLYLDGSLALPARVQLEDHLRRCRPCSDELELLGAMDRMLLSWGEVRTPVPGVTHDRIMRSVDRKRRLVGVLSLGRMMPAAVGTSAAALLVLVTVNLSGLYRNPASTPTPVQQNVPGKIVRQSAPLIHQRRTSAILGSYGAQPPRPANIHRLALDVN